MSEAPHRITKAEMIAMAATACAILIVIIYANVQKFRRDKIESVTVTRFTPAPSSSPRR